MDDKIESFGWEAYIFILNFRTNDLKHERRCKIFPCLLMGNHIKIYKDGDMDYQCA